MHAITKSSPTASPAATQAVDRAADAFQPAFADASGGIGQRKPLLQSRASGQVRRFC